MNALSLRKSGQSGERDACVWHRTRGSRGGKLAPPDCWKARLLPPQRRRGAENNRNVHGFRSLASTTSPRLCYENRSRPGPAHQHFHLSWCPGRAGGLWWISSRIQRIPTSPPRPHPGPQLFARLPCSGINETTPTTTQCILVQARLIFTL
jgi:hypothetical protein